MVNRIFLLVLLTLVMPVAAFADTAVVQNTGDNRYKRVRLTPEIYNHAQPGLTDILIKDQHGNTVPFFINNYAEAVDVLHRSYAANQIYSFIKYDATYFDFAVAQPLPPRDVVANSLAIDTNSTNFAKNINVYGSFDDLHWEFVTSTIIYDIDGMSRLTIDLPQPSRYGFYRVGILNNIENVAITSLTAVFNESTFQRKYFEESLAPPHTVTTHQNTTIIEINGLRNMSIAEIIIVTDSMFKRTVRAAGRRHEIYNLEFSDVTLSNTAIPLHGYTSRDDTLAITIYNHDDAPINIQGVEVIYNAHDLIFDGGDQSSQFFIHFNAPERTIAPIFDITRYKDRVLLEAIDDLSIETIIPADSHEETLAGFDYGFVFNIVVYVAIAGLLVVILVKLKRS